MSAWGTEQTANEREQTGDSSSAPHEKRRLDPAELAERGVPDETDFLGVDVDGFEYRFSAPRWRVYRLDNGDLETVFNVEPGRAGRLVEKIGDEIGWETNNYQSDFLFAPE